MKKYIRTQDGRIADVDAFIEQEKASKYYKDHVFDEIENRDDGCYLHWTAIGTEENPDEGQRGVRCDFEAQISSPFVKQANTIKDLCERFVLVDKNEYYPPLEQELIGKSYDAMFDELKFRLSEGSDLAKISFYGAVWTDKGLIYVAKLNGKGELRLI